jgi:enolase
MSKIFDIKALEILDSRGNPTVRCKVYLEDGSIGIASVPSGASVGSYEALELRDKEKDRYSGKGTKKAVRNINTKIRDSLIGIDAAMQGEIDTVMRRLDGTENKSGLGANATLAVSLAVCDAAAKSKKIPLYRHIEALFKGEPGNTSPSLSTPMLNILNGGAHAKNNLEIQEFMILPLGFSDFAEKLRAGAEIYQSLKAILTNEGYSFSIGDEGGFAPDFESDEVALDMIVKAIENAGYTTNQIKLALDVASSEWYETGSYNLKKRGEKKNTDQLIEYISELVERYPIVSVEDGLSEDDYFGHERLTELLGGRVMLVGDDLFATNKSRLEYGIKKKIANTILIKPNQIGTLTEVLDVIALAKSAGYEFIISHRSGETEDSFIADLAAATGAKFIKTGAPRGSERLAKYNRLLEIEEGL